MSKSQWPPLTYTPACEECGKKLTPDLVAGQLPPNRAMYGTSTDDYYFACQAHLGILGDLYGIVAEMPEMRPFD